MVPNMILFILCYAMLILILLLVTMMAKRLLKL